MRTTSRVLAASTALFLSLGLAACSLPGFRSEARDEPTSHTTRDHDRDRDSRSRDRDSRSSGDDSQSTHPRDHGSATPSVSASLSDSTPHTPGSVIPSKRLRVGECLDFEPADIVLNVTLRDCNEAHMYEVYFIYTIPGDTLPDVDSMRKQRQDACHDSFEPYVGISYESSTTYEASSLQPYAPTWDQGDHDIKCMLSPRDGSGTLVGSGRNTHR